MTQDEGNPRTDDSAQGDNLSATGMFRRAFGLKSEEAAETSDSTNRSSEAREGGAINHNAGRQSDEVGEFTRMFERVRSASAAPVDAEPPLASRKPESRPESTAPEPGEFTRIFLGRPTTRSSEHSKRANEPDQAARVRGFSSQSASESTSAEGSVTQLLRTPASTPTMSKVSPANPVDATSSAESKPLEVRENSDKPSGAPGPFDRRIMNLLESLSTSDRTVSHTLASEQLLSPLAAGGDTSGVTRLIQSLANDEAAGYVEPQPRPATPQEKSGPGEYTRMVRRPEDNSQDPHVTPQVQLPSPSLKATPPVPPAPIAAQPTKLQPAAPPAPIAPALKKSKLEGVAPVLLAVNTLLLVAVLMMLILLLRTR